MESLIRTLEIIQDKYPDFGHININETNIYIENNFDLKIADFYITNDLFI